MRTRRDDQGTITLWTLGLCACLLFLGGLSLDLWRVFGVHQRLAEAADAAATAGAAALDERAIRTTGSYQLDPGDAEQRALTHLAGEADHTLVTDAGAAAIPRRITVRVSGTVHFSLLRVFLPDDPFDVTVTATATPARGAP